MSETVLILGGTSAVAELLVAEARFDPADDDSMASAIERALTDDALQAKLDEQARMLLPGWDAVADRVAAVYERLLARPRPPARRPGSHSPRVGRARSRRRPARPGPGGRPRWSASP